ncbi:MAG: response regulator [Bacteroidaceae bacterium]|nr:response regulator [Bacteroidaceae bacterium]
MKQGTIIICDDNTEILTALGYALEGMFQRIIKLSHPDRLLPTMAAETVDIVLLDMNFQRGVNNGLEGLQWLKTLHERHPDVPVVLLTAYGDVPLAVRALKSGAADFITKPWDNDELIRKLSDVLTTQQEVAPLDEVEQAHIRRAVDRADGNLTVAARMLGVTRQTLYNKLNRK